VQVGKKKISDLLQVQGLIEGNNILGIPKPFCTPELYEHGVEGGYLQQIMKQLYTKFVIF
jgi:hypothetical protein